jgi:hypothetical protein
MTAEHGPDLYASSFRQLFQNVVKERGVRHGGRVSTSPRAKMLGGYATYPAPHPCYAGRPARASLHGRSQQCCSPMAAEHGPDLKLARIGELLQHEIQE